MPAKVPGWTDPQRVWIAQLDQLYLPHYLHIRRTEAEARRRPAADDEKPTPLFPLPAKERPADPVRFVADDGRYQSGTIAAAERAKLPPDALAIVASRKFLFWFPSDTRSCYWLLAELYAAARRGRERRQRSSTNSRGHDSTETGN